MYMFSILSLNCVCVSLHSCSSNTESHFCMPLRLACSGLDLVFVSVQLTGNFIQYSRLPIERFQNSFSTYSPIQTYSRRLATTCYAPVQLSGKLLTIIITFSFFRAFFFINTLTLLFYQVLVLIISYISYNNKARQELCVLSIGINILPIYVLSRGEILGQAPGMKWKKLALL
jgi:hypothetical protein